MILLFLKKAGEDIYARIIGQEEKNNRLVDQLLKQRINNLLDPAPEFCMNFLKFIKKGKPVRPILSIVGSLNYKKERLFK